MCLPDAFKSKAEIYRVRGETTLAIINYTQAIKCRPEDDDNYFKRAEMYEKRNEILLAMEDYAKVSHVATDITGSQSTLRM